METSSEHLAIESFSRSWLTSNVNSSLLGLETPFRASLDSSHEAISEELQYKMPKSRRSVEEAPNFNFDVPISESLDGPVHADQLFSDGIIRPVFINRSKIETNLVPIVQPSFPSRTAVSVVQIHCRILGRWRRVLPACFRYVRRLYHKLRGSRISTRVDNDERIAWEVNSRSYSTQASPKIRTAYSSPDVSYDSESSIYEAVLHCKRSMDK